MQRQLLTRAKPGQTAAPKPAGPSPFAKFMPRPLVEPGRSLLSPTQRPLVPERVLQPKLRIGQPDDLYEREADRVAEEVLRSPAPPAATSPGDPPNLQKKCAACAGGGAPCPKCAEEEESLQRKPLGRTITPLLQRQAEEPEEEEEEEETLQRKPLGRTITPLLQRQAEEPEEEEEEEEEEETLQAKGLPGAVPEATPGLESRLNSLRGRGQPLPASTRAFFEPRFGYDFSKVRIHHDSEAAQAAESVHARAFALGHDVVFAAGQYGPGALSGRKLLAHELTHVVQQGLYRADMRIRRAFGQDATQMCITKEWARNLSDSALAEQIGRVREQLLTLSPETPEHEAALRNLQILESEAGQRPQPIKQLAPQLLPAATVILVGSPTETDVSPYNFSKSAVTALPKVKAALPGTTVTILYFSPGFKLRGENVYRKALKDLVGTGASVLEVTTSDQVVSFLNTGLVSPEESSPTRAVKVSRFYYFGHGRADMMLLNWGWRDQETEYLKTDDIIDIKREAFDPKGKSYFFTCHIAEGEENFMSAWASHLGQTSIGPQGSQAYNAWYEASDLEKEINKELPEWFLGLPYMNAVKITSPERELDQQRRR